MIPTSMCPVNSQASIWDRSTTSKKWEENVLKIRTVIAAHSLFTTVIDSNRGLVNFFTNTQAAVAQTHDLLNARQVGEQGYVKVAVQGLNIQIIHS